MVNEFGKYIRGEREANKITLRKFADQIGVTPTYVSKIEELRTLTEEIKQKYLKGRNEDEN